MISIVCKAAEVVIFSSLYYPWEKGGAEVATRLLAESLSHYYNLAVVSVGPTDTEEYINGVRLYRVSLPTALRLDETSSRRKWGGKALLVLSALSPANHRHVYRRMMEIFEVLRPKLVHFGNSMFGMPIAAMYKASRDSGAQVIQSVRDGYLLGLSTSGWKRYPVWSTIVSRWLDQVDVVHLPSKFFLSTYQTQARKARSVYIPETVGVDFDRDKWLLQIEAKRRDRVFKIAYLGSLDEHKGVTDLARVYSKLAGEDDSVELWIAGSGPAAGQVWSLLADKVRQGRVRLFGRVAWSQAQRILQQSHVVVLPSRCHESFGRILIEGFYQGCVPIGSRLGAIPEVIPDESLLFSNPEEMLVRLTSLIDDRERWFCTLEHLEGHMLQYQLREHLRSFDALYSALLRSPRRIS